MANIKVGETGTLWLIDTDGNYVYYPAFADAAKDGMNISDSTELGEYIDKIRSEESGKGSFSWEVATRLLYWDDIDGMNWVMGLTITESEIFKDVTTLLIISIIVCIIAKIKPFSLNIRK